MCVFFPERHKECGAQQWWYAKYEKIFLSSYTRGRVDAWTLPQMLVRLEGTYVHCCRHRWSTTGGDGDPSHRPGEDFCHAQSSEHDEQPFFRYLLPAVLRETVTVSSLCRQSALRSQSISCAGPFCLRLRCSAVACGARPWSVMTSPLVFSAHVSASDEPVILRVQR